MKHPKFIQICTDSDGGLNALDENGEVWTYGQHFKNKPQVDYTKPVMASDTELRFGWTLLCDDDPWPLKP